MLTGKVASASVAITDTDELVSGGASLKDLETMFQLIYLRFTQPRADETIFGVITTQTKAALANQKSMPEFAFAEALSGALSQNHLRARPFTAELVDEMSLAKSLAFYKDRFADASDFTFMFVGSFDLATIKPLVERYLGALPSTGRRETWKDVGPHPPRGVVVKQVFKGIEPKSQAAVVFTGPFQYDQSNRIAIRAMSQILENRLRDVLREDLGGTYSVSVGASYEKYPRQEFEISIDFGASPDRLENLIKTVFDQIELLKKTGPTEQQVADVKESMLRDFEQSTKQNGYLLNQISLRYQFGEDLKEFFSIPELYKKVAAATIQDAAKAYLDTGNYVRVTLMPEKK
jgi:zinc protease